MQQDMSSLSVSKEQAVPEGLWDTSSLQCVQRVYMCLCLGLVSCTCVLMNHTCCYGVGSPTVHHELCSLGTSSTLNVYEVEHVAMSVEDFVSNMSTYHDGVLSGVLFVPL
jgi:hypothetical protein